MFDHHLCIKSSINIVMVNNTLREMHRAYPIRTLSYYPDSYVCNHDKLESWFGFQGLTFEFIQIRVGMHYGNWTSILSAKY